MSRIIRTTVITGVLFLFLKWIGVNSPDIWFLCFIGIVAQLADKPKQKSTQINQNMQQIKN